MMSPERLIIWLPTVMPAAFQGSMMAPRLCAVQGAGPPPPRTQFTPSCLMRRGPADGSAGGLPRPPSKASPVPKAIFGVSGPSGGGAGTWPAASGVAAADANAPAPITSRAVLREKFMIGTFRDVVYTNFEPIWRNENAYPAP